MSSENLNSMRAKPVYDTENNKLLGWKLFYLVQKSGVLSPIVQSRFFKESFLQNSYRAMCRFKEKLLMKQNENNK